MDKNKIRQRSTDELNADLKTSGEQMFRLRLQLAMGQTEGLKKYREMRKDRARTLTVLREREIAGEAK